MLCYYTKYSKKVFRIIFFDKQIPSHIYKMEILFFITVTMQFKESGSLSLKLPIIHIIYILYNIECTTFSLNVLFSSLNT